MRGNLFRNRRKPSFQGLAPALRHQGMGAADHKGHKLVPVPGVDQESGRIFDLSRFHQHGRGPALYLRYLLAGELLCGPRPEKIPEQGMVRID